MAAGSTFHAMKRDPRRHNTINLIAALCLLSIMVGTALLGAVLPLVAYVPVALMLFGCSLFGVNILIIHECSHNMFLLSRDRKRQKRLNRLVGRAAALPFFTDYIRHWEKGHTIHHLRPCEPDDPQDNDPLTGRPLLRRYLLLALVPFSFVPFNPSNQYPGRLTRAAVGTAVFWLPVGLLTGLLIGWHVPLLLLLSMHTVVLLNWTKKAQEHGGGLAEEPDYVLRSRTYFYPTAPMTSPFNINYHFEHHANFNVPWYDLPAYHRALREIVPAELQPYYFHRDFFAQLAGTKPLPPRELLGIEVPMTATS
jgi:fatty acid desaturase